MDAPRVKEAFEATGDEPTFYRGDELEARIADRVERIDDAAEVYDINR